MNRAWLRTVQYTERENEGKYDGKEQKKKRTAH